jgi:HAD superfamily hydrolase (TIGR01509 family)
MIQAVIFDLDGVLVDADEWHFEALNLALADHDMREIAWQEHLSIYKGLPTARKLEIYAERNKVATPRTINHGKQFWTEQFIKFKGKPQAEIVDMIERLAERYEIVVASNAIRSSVELMLKRTEIFHHISFFLSNEDVEHSKPNPEIYWAAIGRLGLDTSECLIVEDSEAGRTAATASGAHTCFVNGPEDVNFYRVDAAIKKANRPNLVIPAAGQGKRFTEQGFIYPKPFIDVNGQPMLRRVLDNFKGEGRPIVLMQNQHIFRYAAHDHFPEATIVNVNGLTEGAACTVLLARGLIDNGNELILANSDQLVLEDLSEFFARARAAEADGAILTFHSDDPKWSYADVAEWGWVRRVAEKEVISNRATVGVYWFRKGSDFVKHADQMISKGIRTNGEFYVCPVFNEMIAGGGGVIAYDIAVDAMLGLGTPEDLERSKAHV